jgi:hypothetical protein
MESKASCQLNKCSTTELQPPPSPHFFVLLNTNNFIYFILLFFVAELRFELGASCLLGSTT